MGLVDAEIYYRFFAWIFPYHYSEQAPYGYMCPTCAEDETFIISGVQCTKLASPREVARAGVRGESLEGAREPSWSEKRLRADGAAKVLEGRSGSRWQSEKREARAGFSCCAYPRFCDADSSASCCFASVRALFCLCVPNLKREWFAGAKLLRGKFGTLLPRSFKEIALEINVYKDRKRWKWIEFSVPGVARISHTNRDCLKVFLMFIWIS